MRYFFKVSIKKYFICLRFWFWIKTHFPLKDPLIYVCQVITRSRVEVLLLWITENKEVLPADSSALKAIFLINRWYLLKNNGPSIEPLGVHSLTLDHPKHCPFSKIFVFYFSESRIVQEPTTEIFTPFLTKSLTT